MESVLSKKLIQNQPQKVPINRRSSRIKNLKDQGNYKSICLNALPSEVSDEEDQMNLESARHFNFKIGSFKGLQYLGKSIKTRSKRKRKRKDSDEDYYCNYQKQAKLKKAQKINKKQKVKRRITKNQKKISYLLKWKRIEKQKIADKKTFQIKKVKEVLTANISKYCNNIMALFINIKWSKTKRLKASKEQGITISQFKKFKISDKVIDNGLCFIWSNKKILGDLMEIMEAQGFVYIENYSFVYLSIKKIIEKLNDYYYPQVKSSKNQKDLSQASIITSATQSSELKNQFIKSLPNDPEELKEYILKEVENLPDICAHSVIFSKKNDYFQSSKKSLLMFRKTAKKKPKLELRHQRSCDIVFDLYNDYKKSYKRNSDKQDHEFPNDQRIKIYQVIETLLPKSINTKKGFKLVELWGNHQPRNGWLKITEERKNKR